jgi:ectoine hydroxylase-related dioxygenase (phytanoyl-CoA dioxygenase family)
MRRDYALGLSSKMSSIEQNFPSEIVAFKGYHHQVTSPLANLGTSLESLLGNKNFVDMVERIIGSHFQVVWIDCYRTRVKANAELDQSWLWHSDNTPVGTLKCMIALTDISSKNGAMAYLNRKNSSRVRKLKYFGDDSQKRNTSVDTLIDNESYLLANAGDVLLFDNNNLHKANVPSSGYRDVMTCLLMPRLVRSSAREKMDNSSLKVDQLPGGFPSNPFLVSSSGFKLNESS